jgi:O-antigen/teichoic acid export membrane protein
MASTAERFLTASTVLAMPLLFGALFLAEPVVRLVAGEPFVPAAHVVWPLMLAFLAVIPSRVCQALAAAVEQPRVVFYASAVRIALLVPLGVALTRLHGTLGMALAFMTASLVQAGVMISVIRVATPLDCRRWAAAAGLGLAVAPLGLLRLSAAAGALLFVAATAAYFLAIRALGIVRVAEVRDLVRALVGRREAQPS